MAGCCSLLCCKGITGLSRWRSLWTCESVAEAQPWWALAPSLCVFVCPNIEWMKRKKERDGRGLTSNETHTHRRERERERRDSMGISHISHTCGICGRGLEREREWEEMHVHLLRARVLGQCQKHSSAVFVCLCVYLFLLVLFPQLNLPHSLCLLLFVLSPLCVFFVCLFMFLIHHEPAASSLKLAHTNEQ